MEINDEHWMRLAIEQAEKGDRTPGAGEVGCVIVYENELVAAGHNEAEMRHDPTAHAEIVALRRLGEQWKSTEFRGVTLYCTLQPCGMCAVACVWAKVSIIVFGASRADVHSMYFDARHINAVDLVRDAFRNDLEIVSGVLAEECSQLYYAPQDRPPPEEQVNT